MRKLLVLFGLLVSFQSDAADCPIEISARLRPSTMVEIEFVVVNKGQETIEVRDTQLPWKDADRLLVALLPKRGEPIQRLYGGGDALFSEPIALLPGEPLSGVVPIGDLFDIQDVPVPMAAVFFWHWTMEVTTGQSCPFGGWLDLSQR